MSDEVRIEQRDGWRKLVLNRPDKLNAANAALLTALLAALDAAEADVTCRALLLTGEGRGFCAGQELGAEVMPTAAGPPDLVKVADSASPARAPAARHPAACGVRGEWRGGGRGGELCAGVRHRAGGAEREIHPGIREDRSGAGFGCQLLPAAAGGRGARPRAGDARRTGRCGEGRGLGDDLAARWTMRCCRGKPRR